MTDTRVTATEADRRGAFYNESIAANEFHPGVQVVAIDSFLRAVDRLAHQPASADRAAGASDREELLRQDLRRVQNNTAIYRQEAKDRADEADRRYEAERQRADAAVAANRRLVALLETPAALASSEREAWKCFHCGDTFTDAACARLHFGRDEDSAPACQIKAGAEQGLLGALRAAEYEASDARRAIADECTEAARAHYAQASRHDQALRNAEEAGYERGLADGRALASTGDAIGGGE